MGPSTLMDSPQARPASARVPAANGARLPPPDYRALFERHHLIFISAKRIAKTQEFDPT